MQKIYKISFLAIVCVLLAVADGSVLAYQNPTVDAGPNLYVTSGKFNSNLSAVLQGSTDNPNGGTLSFFWDCTNGSLSNNNTPQPLFTAPTHIWWTTNYTCMLTVTDNYGFSGSDSTTVYINYNNNVYTYNLSAQTNPASNIANGQAVLNGTIAGSNISGTVYAWFQWGETTSYGFESQHRPIGYLGSFDQHIADLKPNATYHFRIGAQKMGGDIVYGQDMTFNSSNYNAYIPNTGLVAGASTVSTGLTNNFWIDSFFLPLFVIVLGLYLISSKKIYRFADKIKAVFQR